MSKQAYDRRVAEGVCVDCESHDLHSGRYCKPCLDYRRESDQSLQERRLNAGECVRCGRPAKADRWRCHRCLAKANEKAKARYRRKVGDRPIRHVTCSRCGQRGHYPTACTRGDQ